MVSTAIAAEVTCAIRDFSAGVETQGRALGSSVRHLVLSAGVSESSRARIAREVQMPPAQLLNWIAGALGAATSLLGAETGSFEPSGGRVVGDFVVIEKSITRC
jgi:transcriptional regulator with XRE-family HTH domain